jgi:hypothetical protein
MKIPSPPSVCVCVVALLSFAGLAAPVSAQPPKAATAQPPTDVVELDAFTVSTSIDS